MGNPYPPNTPPMNPAPVRTPVPVQNNAILFKNMQGWQKFFDLLYFAVTYLLSNPVILSGLDSSLPTASNYPANSIYYATDSKKIYVNIYATPGQPSSAAWTSVLSPKIVSQTTAAILTAAQTETQFYCTGTFTLTLPVAVTGLRYFFFNGGSGNITIAGTVNGNANGYKLVNKYQYAEIECLDGAAWYVTKNN